MKVDKVYMINKRTLTTIILLILSVIITACRPGPLVDKMVVKGESSDYIYTLYDNLDLSHTVELYQNLDSSYCSYRAEGIPLVPLSETDIDEYYRCLESIYDNINREYIAKNSESNTLVLNYDDGTICGEYLHSVVHINTGRIASAKGEAFRPSFVPEFQSVDEEFCINEFDEHQNECYELLDGQVVISDIIAYNNSVLHSIHIPYMDQNIDLYTQKIKVFGIGSGKKVIACYSQAEVAGMPVDNENGYYSDQTDVIPSSWRCVTFYVAPGVIDVVDIFRGINNISVSEDISINFYVEQVLQIVSDHLPKKQLFVVYKIEFLYAYYPIELYEGLYLDEIPVQWNDAYLLYPMWKINIYDAKAEETHSFFVDPSTGELNEYRTINPGY